MSFWDSFLDNLSEQGRLALPLVAFGIGGIPAYLQNDLAGGSSNGNSLAINDMANWYNTHKYTNADLMQEESNWEDKPYGWSDYSILPNGIPAKSWYVPHDGEDNLRTAFELAEKINPTKYKKPVLTDDLFQAYKRYAKDGILELGDDENLWDIYAKDSSLNHEYIPVQHANWLAAYRDDINYLAELAAEGGDNNPYKRAYQHFLNMAKQDGASQLDRQIFRKNLEEIHKLRMQNPDRFFEEKDTEGTKNSGSTAGTGTGSNTGSTTKRISMIPEHSKLDRLKSKKNQNQNGGK